MAAHSVGAATTTVRNARGQVTQIIDPLGNKTGEEDEAGAKSTWTYGQHNLPETITRAGGKKTLAYDGVGNKVSETDFRGNETTFAYDGANRLVTRTESLGKVTGYAYDGIGNVLTETDALNRITTHEYDALSHRTKTVDAAQGIWLMGYDGNGNKTSGKVPLGRVTTYAYDGLNRLALQTAPLGKYFNDYRGLRVEKEAVDPLHPDAGPMRLRTLRDGRNAFQDSIVDGVVTARYENDGRHPVSMWSRDDGVQLLHRDALGSIVATTDTTGQLKSETIYDAWGKVQTSTGASANKFGYTGHQMDHETGLVYFQARYYDPELGRFITQDPYEGDFQTPLSLHHYLYAYGNPTTYLDLHSYEGIVANDDTAVQQERHITFSPECPHGCRPDERSDSQKIADRNVADRAQRKKMAAARNAAPNFDEQRLAGPLLTGEKSSTPGADGDEGDQIVSQYEKDFGRNSRLTQGAKTVAVGASKTGDFIAENCFPSCGVIEGKVAGMAVGGMIKLSSKATPVLKAAFKDLMRLRREGKAGLNSPRPKKR